MVLRAAIAFFGALPLLARHAPASAMPLSPEIEDFIEVMAARHEFNRGQLRDWFKRVKPQTAVLRAMSAPGTARPWHEFRRSNVNEARIRGGVEFWDRNAGTLARAAAEYGVPESLIVATIGIETVYGKNVGGFATLDTLVTLAFNYSPRAEFFRNELEEYLLLARENKVSPLTYKGSYAGALGIAQFIPSSYRRYAVDYDGDGKRDLWTNADAIGSVANYYRAWGWQTGQPVVVPVEAPVSEESAAVRMLLERGFQPHTPVAQFKEAGVTPAGDAPDELLATLIAVEGDAGTQHLLGFTNFYVITRYNRSTNYALAVHELAREIARGRPGPGAGP